MGWRRLGRVFAPLGAHPALLTHAALPTPFVLGGDLVRVFYSGRDGWNRSSVGSIVLRVGDVPRVEEADPAPVLTPGGIGAFDDAGVGVGSVAGDRLYFMGWNVGGAVPWRNAIGVAFGDPHAGRFERGFAGPVMDRDPVDPYSLSYPSVLRFAEDDWRMWYGTHLAWGAAKADMSHAIRGARSRDGLAWARDPLPCVPPEGEEIATVRPTVLRDGDGLAMWFARRTEEGPYALGAARSADGAAWARTGAGLVAEEAWEGGAITYPAAFEAAGRRWLLFNGAGYGATGFGLAVREG